MHPDSIIIDFEKDINGNITKIIFTTIVKGEIYCYDVPYNHLVLPLAVMMETVLDNEIQKEQMFQKQIQKEIQELVG
jgi:hypothetical protein